MLPICGVPVIFKYGETKILNLPKEMILPSYFLIEEIKESEKLKVEAKTIIPRKRQVK